MLRLKAAGGMALFVVLLGAALFGGAGRADLPMFWAYLAVMSLLMTAGILSADPDLMRERLKPGPGGKDRCIRAKMMPALLAHFAVAGLDVGRYHWSDTVPLAAQAAALAVVAAAFMLPMWAARANRFFSPVVRLQTDRGHTLVTTGPYAYVRHPGYLGSLIWTVASGIALGSWLSLVPALGAAAIILRRLLIEDRFLHEQLPGYPEYAQRVRARLVPGIW